MVDLQLKTTAFALVRARSAALTRLAAELPSQRLDHLIHLVGTVDLVTLVLQHLMGGFDQFRVERGLALDDQLRISAMAGSPIRPRVTALWAIFWIC